MSNVDVFETDFIEVVPVFGGANFVVLNVRNVETIFTTLFGDEWFLSNQWRLCYVSEWSSTMVTAMRLWSVNATGENHIKVSTVPLAKLRVSTEPLLLASRVDTSSSVNISHVATT